MSIKEYVAIENVFREAQEGIKHFEPHLQDAVTVMFVRLMTRVMRECVVTREEI